MCADTPSGAGPYPGPRRHWAQRLAPVPPGGATEPLADSPDPRLATAQGRCPSPERRRAAGARRPPGSGSCRAVQGARHRSTLPSALGGGTPRPAASATAHSRRPVPARRSPVPRCHVLADTKRASASDRFTAAAVPGETVFFIAASDVLNKISLNDARGLYAGIWGFDTRHRGDHRPRSRRRVLDLGRRQPRRAPHARRRRPGSRPVPAAHRAHPPPSSHHRAHHAGARSFLTAEPENRP